MIHSHQSLKAQLSALGIIPGDTLLIHSSLRSMGNLEGGAETLLLALKEQLGHGLLVMPTLTWDSVNDSQPVFDVARSRCCVGALPELFRQQPGVQRSWHPTHSVAAWGDDAVEFVEGHQRFDTPCARASPWGHLVERDAKILFLGTGLACNTLIHGVEEWAEVPGRLTTEPQYLQVTTPSGYLVEVPSRRHIGDASQYYAKLEPVFDAAGALRKGQLGDASCHLVFSSLAARATLALLDKDIQLFSHPRLP
ncbi:MAG: AAC(3) family N-acetyltransferase [candidate division FCPU426 bacterium]